MATGTTHIPRAELLGIADTVARDKNIDREEILKAMELAIQKSSRARYGFERDIQATIDRKTGEIQLFACQEVVDVVENPVLQIALDDAVAMDSTLGLGDIFRAPLPPMDLGRVAAQTAKQVIFQYVRDAERFRQYEEFKSQMGQMVNGLVKRVEFGNVYVELSQTEAFLSRDQMIPREVFRPGDRIRAYIMDVRSEQRGPQIFLSRVHPNFMMRLFAQEVPEIYNGTIEIKSIARDPGSRAKMAVYSMDRALDPLASCIGFRGARVQAVTNELQGEKIDIIPWAGNPAEFVVNALVPAEVTKVVLDEETGRVEVTVPDEKLSLAIGRRGQNVRLASILTGWSIDILSESAESERRIGQIKALTDLFVQALDVDEVLAHLLANEGFVTVEEVAYVDRTELLSIQGIEDDLATELQRRAAHFLKTEEDNARTAAVNAGIAGDVLSLEGMSGQLLTAFCRVGLKTLDDLGDLDVGELRDIAPFLTEDEAKDFIMKARAHWFDA